MRVCVRRRARFMYDPSEVAKTVVNMVAHTRRIEGATAVLSVRANMHPTFLVGLPSLTLRPPASQQAFASQPTLQDMCHFRIHKEP